jgi:photosystem II stability/assembly factor-like uncharacterized protein
MKTAKKTFKSLLVLSVLFTLTLLYSESLNAQSGWFPQATETTNNLNSICFINSTTGWVVGDNNVILKTTNGGLNWAPASFIPPLNDEFTFKAVCFSNSSTGWVAGDIFKCPPGQHFRVIINTNNSGESWDVNLIDNKSELNSICYRNIDAGFAVGPNTILKSTDLGKSWENQRFPYGENDYYTFRAVCFINPSTGWVAGDLFRNPLNSYYKAILRTEDGGANWTQQYLGNCAGLYSINFPSALIGWAVGYNIILKTINKGDSWTEQTFGSENCDYYLNSVFFINSLRGWVAGGLRCDPGSGYSKIILITSDGGVNWNEVSISAEENNYLLHSVFFVNEMTGWAVGDGGAILKTTNGGFNFTIGIESENNTIPGSSNLYQNYPNPFNPTTRIIFQVPLSKGGIQGVVSLKVYNILGKDVATLVNEKLQPGIYEVTFDGSDLSSGVYFYKLSVGNYVGTKRMILIK